MRLEEEFLGLSEIEVNEYISPLSANKQLAGDLEVGITSQSAKLHVLLYLSQHDHIFIALRHKQEVIL